MQTHFDGTEIEDRSLSSFLRTPSFLFLTGWSVAFDEPPHKADIENRMKGAKNKESAKEKEKSKKCSCSVFMSLFTFVMYSTAPRLGVACSNTIFFFQKRNIITNQTQ